MSLNSIRESYSKLLAALSDAGVKLNESQKADLDTFVLAIESNISRQRETAVRQTRRLVEKKMEKEYRQVFESIMANQMANSELAAKIQDKITQINETKKIASHVDNFLDLYVESVLPKKTIVDYDRMAKLERLHESLKDALLVGEDAVQEKMQSLEESYRVKASKCETQVAKAKAELNESMKKAREMKKRLDSVEAKELLESKVKDLPTYEARKVRKQLKEATAPEIEKKFDETLESVKKGMGLKEAEDEVQVEAEIEKILEGEDGEAEVEEDDMLRNRPHNAHRDENLTEGEDEVEEDDLLKDRPHNAHIPANESEEDDEPFETMESVRETEDGDVELDESDVIDSDLMKMWCNQSVEVR